MTILTEGRHPAEFVLSEAAGHRSRSNITIGAEQTIVPGQVVAQLLADHGAVTVGNPAFAGAGNGTLTKATPAYGAGVIEGTYTVVCIEKTADGGLFDVRRPDGTADGVAKAGVAYDGQVKFTVADGATDFDAGDAFTLAVTIADPAGAGNYVALDPAGADGSEVAAAIALYGATTGAGETAPVSAITRDAEVKAPTLTWPAGITADQKAAAIAALATKGVIVR